MATRQLLWMESQQQSDTNGKEVKASDSEVLCVRQVKLTRQTIHSEAKKPLLRYVKRYIFTNGILPLYTSTLTYMLGHALDQWGAAILFSSVFVIKMDHLHVLWPRFIHFMRSVNTVHCPKERENTIKTRLNLNWRQLGEMWLFQQPEVFYKRDSNEVGTLKQNTMICTPC